MSTWTTGGPDRPETRPFVWVVGGALAVAGAALFVVSAVWFFKGLAPADDGSQDVGSADLTHDGALQGTGSRPTADAATSSREGAAGFSAVDFAAPLELSGVVVNASGSRAAGAAVAVLTRSASALDAAAPEPPLARTLTGADGGFAFPRLPRVDLDLVARTPDGATAFASIDASWLGAATRFGPLSLVAEAGATVEGRVIGLDRSGLDGGAAAKVKITFEGVVRGATGDAEWFDAGERAGIAVPIDESGRFVLTGVPRPALGGLHVVARGGGAAGFAELPSSPWPPAPVEIRAERQAECAGSVVDAGGAPVAGAKIVHARGHATAGADGRFRFPVDPRDAGAPIEAIVSADGFAWRVVSLDAAAPAPVVLERGLTIQGVVQSGGGAPAEGAWVRVEGRRFVPGSYDHPRLDKLFAAARLHVQETRSLRAGPRGEFAFAALPNEALDLTAGWPGFPGTGAPHVSRPPESGVVMILTEAPLGCGSVEGRVVDSRTRAAASPFRAVVVTDWGVLRALPARDGTFRLERCPAGTWKLRVVPGPGASFAPAERWIGLDVNEALRDLVVEVSGRGRAVLTLDAPPAQELVLTLSPVEGDALADPPAAECPVAGTEAVFEDLPAGVYAVHAVKGTMAVARPVRLRVEAGQTASARVAIVSGRLLYIAVSSRDGEPTLAPYGVRIRDGAGGAVLLDKRPGPGRALSGAGASAVLPPGRYWITLDRSDRTIAEREVVVPKDDGAFAAFEIRADDK